MKIVIIGPTWPYRGGIAHYNNCLCTFLKKRNHEIYPLSFKILFPKFLYPGKMQKDTSQTKHFNFKSEVLINSINPINWIKVINKINKISPDFVLIYWWTPFFSLMYRVINKFVKCKIYCLCHNVLPHDKSIVDKLLTKFALKNVNNFIVHGIKEKKTLQKLFTKIPNENISISDHPSYGFQFKDSEITQDEARNYLKLKNKVLLFFGFVRQYKGLKYLLEAMRIINEKYNDITLLIVGEFWDNKFDYLNIINREPKITNVQIFDKYIPDKEVKYYFQAADIVVLPYISATSSGIVQIAFAFNKPVIVTNVGVLSETVADKKTGFVIPPEKPEAIAEAIFEFYNKTDRIKMSENIKKDSYRFSWDRLVDALEEFK